jgi:hypothetical protein
MPGSLNRSASPKERWSIGIMSWMQRSRRPGASNWRHYRRSFSCLKEGRIRLLGEQLKAIQTEIGKRDLSKVKTDKLMELQLRYFGELKVEYVKTGQRTKISPKLNSRDINEQLETVLIRYRAGEIDEAQAKQEQAILQSILKAIEQTELEERLEKIEAVLKSRR